MIRVQHYRNEYSWLRAIAGDFVEAVEAAWSEGRRPVICLAGGSTPRPAFIEAARLLAARPVHPHGPVILVVGDERLRPRDRAEHNEAMIRDAFAPALETGAAVLLGWDIDTEEAAAIAAMEAALGRLVAEGTAPSGGGPAGGPLFDACYLGLGADGHTAGAFPGTAAAASDSVAAGCRSPSPPLERVTLTPRTLASSRRTRYIVRAAGKEEALARLGAGDASCPAVIAASGDAAALVLY